MVAAEGAVGTSTPGNWPPGQQQRPARPLNRRAREIRIAIGLTLLLAAAGVLAWSASDPSGYQTSARGCVTVTVASSMGGALHRECGAAARSWCHSAYQQYDPFALRVQQQCRLAGLETNDVGPP